MKAIVELDRFSSPFPRPQALFADATTLWVSSRATKKLYALDRATRHITWETETTDGQTVWGVTKVGGALYVVCGEDAPDVDARTIRRYVPGQGFDASYRVACPDGMGSHLSHDGHTLVLSQWYPQKLISIGDDGQPGRVLKAPTQIVGHCFAHGAFHLATTDDEESNNYHLERLDPATGKTERLARIGFPARALAFDGVDFWTNHRERDQIVRFNFA